MWFSRLWLSSSGCYFAGIQILGYDTSTSLFSSTPRVKFLLRTLVCFPVITNFIEKKLTNSQPNTHSGSSLDTSSTTPSDAAHSTGGKDTTVNIPFPHSTIRKLTIHPTDLLQAAMDTGTAIATVIIFFALSYNNIDFNWWGNTVGDNTYDAKSTPWLKVKTGGHFGKGPGQF